MDDTDIQIDDLEVEIYNDGFRDGYQQALSEMPETIELNCDNFCDWVRRLKEESGYTIKAFAAKTGMSTYAISRYTERNLLPSLYSVERIAKAFGKKIMVTGKNCQKFPSQP